MNTDAEAKDTKYKTDKEKVSETSKGADKETRKEADTPVKETGSEKESAGRSSVPPVNTEDNLELHSLPFRERQHARRQRLKDHMEGMTTGQKAGYILSYYKGKIILAVIILAVCIARPVTIYKKSRPVALSFCVEPI